MSTVQISQGQSAGMQQRKWLLLYEKKRVFPIQEMDRQGKHDTVFFVYTVYVQLQYKQIASEHSSSNKILEITDTEENCFTSNIMDCF